MPRAPDASPGAPVVPRPSPLERLAPALVGAGLLACAAGLLFERTWAVLPVGRFGESLLLMGLVALLAWPLVRLREWRWADAMALAWGVLLAWLGGVAGLLGAGVLCAGACALGSLLPGAGRPLPALLCGLAMLATLAGVSLAWPIHHPWTWGPLLVGLAVWRWRELRTLAQMARTEWHEAVGTAPRAAAWTVALLGLASSACWPPTLQADDLAYHLGLPWQLTVNGRYAMDVRDQVWSLAPWASDVLHGIAQLLTGQEARGAVNAAWLLATAAGLWRIGAHLALEGRARWGVLALFASLPLTAGLLGGMQTETAATAVTVGLVAWLLEPGPIRGRAWGVGLLVGLLFALKPLHGLAILPVLAWAGWRRRGQPLAVAPMAGAIGLALVVAAPSYLQSWWHTGNPVLPLFNHVFQSPWFQTAPFDDPRWHAGGGLALPWRITFDTSAYLEGWDGGAGFVLVALGGAWLLALGQARTRGLAIAASLVLLLPLLGIDYVRYMHPGMVLLLPVLVAVLQSALAPRLLACVLVAVCGLNLAYVANSNWLLHVGAPKRMLAAAGRDAPLFARYAPERSVARQWRSEGHAGEVLLMTRPAHAEYAGQGHSPAWYSPAWMAIANDANRDASGRHWQAVLRRHGIREVVLDTANGDQALRAALASMGAERAPLDGDAEWWRLPATDAPQ